MPQLKETPFTAYEFTPEEYEQVIFSPIQEMWIRTELANAAMAKLAASTKPNATKDDYLQINAYYEGQVELLTFLLSMSNGIKEGMISEILDKRRAMQEAQQRLNDLPPANTEGM